MTFQSTPTKDGTYRIKVLNQDIYLEAVPQSESIASTPWICLAAVDSSSDKQKVPFAVVDSTTVMPGVLTPA